MQTKLLSYELTPWTPIHNINNFCGHNWWRFIIRDGIISENQGIGLMREENNTWSIYNLAMGDYDFLIQKIIDKFIHPTLYLGKLYNHTDLEQAKEEIDNIIRRINNLKCFL